MSTPPNPIFSLLMIGVGFKTIWQSVFSILTKFFTAATTSALRRTFQISSNVCHCEVACLTTLSALNLVTIFIAIATWKRQICGTTPKSLLSGVCVSSCTYSTNAVTTATSDLFASTVTIRLYRLTQLTAALLATCYACVSFIYTGGYSKIRIKFLPDWRSGSGVIEDACLFFFERHSGSGASNSHNFSNFIHHILTFCIVMVIERDG